MKHIVSLTVCFSVVFLAMTPIVTADVPHQMYYQGHLADAGGAPLDTTVSMTFTIYDDSASGATVWWTETQPNVVVINGLFNVILGSQNGIRDTVFADTIRWLGITVGADSEITPRYKLVTVPYAYHVATVDGATGGVILGDVDIQSDLTVSGKATIGPGHTNTGSYAFVAGQDNTVDNWASTVGGGSSNIASEMYSAVSGGANNQANGEYSSVGGGALNIAGGQYSTVSGGESNTANLYGSTVSGGHDNLADTNYATVGGGYYNLASGYQSTIGGGAVDTASGDYSTIGGGVNNSVDSLYGTIAGGYRNTARGDRSTVGGGSSNYASGWRSTIAGGAFNQTAATEATVGGGQSNMASGYASTVGGGKADSALGSGSTVSGGHYNVAEGNWGTVSGGHFNIASGYESTVGGGYYDTASGHGSTVCGGRENHAEGAYGTIGGGVGNSNAGDRSAIPGGSYDTLTSNANWSMAFGNTVYLDSQYRVVFFDSVYSGRLGINRDDHNAGGIAYPIHVGTHTTNGNGAHLTAGGSWQDGSSRTFKENFQPLNSHDLLAKISSLPVQTWQYKDTDERHIGPVSEDFVEAFDVGTAKNGKRDDKYLSPGDVAGVALAGVKELAQQKQKLKEELDKISRQNQELREIIEKLTQRITQLEKTK